MSQSGWLSAREAWRRLRAAGVPPPEMDRAIARQCLRRGLLATGFGRVHDGDKIARNENRTFVPKRVWRVLAAEERGGLECFVLWEQGSISWMVPEDKGEPLEETWDSIEFDLVSFQAFERECRAMASNHLLEISEIREWIVSECETENSKAAWTAFRGVFGSRTGAKAAFEACWKDIKGPRGRGRLPNPGRPK